MFWAKNYWLLTFFLHDKDPVLLSFTDPRKFIACHVFLLLPIDMLNKVILVVKLGKIIGEYIDGFLFQLTVT